MSAQRKIGGYLRPLTVSQYLGIPLEEVQKMLESGELPGIKIQGQWRVPVEQLEQWLDEEVSPEELKKLATHLKDVDPEKVEHLLREEAPQGSPTEEPADRKRG